MASSVDLSDLTGMTKEVRESVAAAFAELSNWRDEVGSVNERCLGKVLKQTSAVARAMGWPDQAVKTTREYLENASKVQTKLLDQIMDGWKRQLESRTAMAVPSAFADQSPTSMFNHGPAGFDPLAPWTFWLQAAELWQRTWMSQMSPARNFRSH